ncbi:hypothetical protein QLX67_07545, partial [Balneolaceae bacterium ANBcel3]|nr:hypothetical protein [Balneolaceae bacterium ANBcel3]
LLQRILETQEKGTKVREQRVEQTGGSWFTFVLMEYPVGLAAHTLLEELQSCDDLYSLFMETEEYRSLREKALEYETE